MKRISIACLSALVLLLVSSACGPSTGTPATQPPAATDAGETPAPDAGAATQTPSGSIPVTGIVVTEEGQFCVLDEAFETLVTDEALTYTVEPASNSSGEPSSEIVCETVETVNGKQVILCHAPSQTSFTLRVCADANSCADVPVDLRTCPPVAGTETATATVTATATLTPAVITETAGASPEASPTTGGETATAAP